jgi:AcrR family transcriptional regulator
MSKTRGRPRDPSRDKAILAAARTVIASSGYTGATMEAIAKLARVGKDTLYRRWSTKERLALDLVDTLAREAVRPAAIDPDPRFNLFMFVKDIVRLYNTTDFGSLVAGLVGEAARNDDFARPFAEFWARRRAIAASLIRDVVGDVAAEAEIEWHLDQLLGPIYYRLLLTHTDVTDEYLWDLVVAIPWSLDDDGPNGWTGQTAQVDRLADDTVLGL